MDITPDFNSPDAQRYKADVQRKVEEMSVEVENSENLPPRERAKKHAQLAEYILYLFPFNQHDPVQTRSILSRAQEMADAAIRISAETPEGHFQRGTALNMQAFVCDVRGDAERTFTEATQSLQKASDLDPGNATYRQHVQQNGQIILVWDQMKEMQQQQQPARAPPASQNAPRKPKGVETAQSRMMRRAAFRYKIPAAIIVGLGCAYAFRQAWGGKLFDKPAFHSIWPSK